MGCVSAWGLGADRRRGHRSLTNKIKTLGPHVRPIRGQSSIRIHNLRAGLDLATSTKIIDSFAFLVRAEQISGAWLGTHREPGSAQRFFKELGEFFAKRKIIPAALDSYVPTVDPTFYENAAE